MEKENESEKKAQRRQFWVIVMIVFLGFIGISIPYLIFPALFLNPAYTILPAEWGQAWRSIFLGITLAAYPLGQFIGSPILGALSDDYGRKRLLSASLLVAAFCYLLTGFSIAWENLSLLILSRFLAGLMEGNIAIARAMAADIKTISKHETFGKINAAASIAFLLGPFLGGLMTDNSLLDGLTTTTPFYFICLLFFGLAGLSYLVLEKRAIITQVKSRGFYQRINLIKRLSVLFSNKQLKFLMIVSTCLTLAVDIFYEFGPVYLTLKWTLDPSQLTLYNGVLCIALATGNGWLPIYLAPRISNKSAIIGSMGGLAVCLVGIVLTNTPYLMILLFALSGLAIGLSVTLLTIKISDSAPDAIQGEVMGVQLSLRVLGDAFICLIGGALLLLSSKIILVLAALMCTATMLYYTFKPKPQSAVHALSEKLNE